MAVHIDVPGLVQANAKRWQAMRIRSDHVAAIDKVVRRMWLNEDFQSRYDAMAEQAQIPAPFIVLAHMRESDGDWNRSLAQGDRLTKRSVHVPAGRVPLPANPPFTFEEAAIDALVVCDHIQQWRDWSIGGMLTALERFNGLGYAARGVSSPYVWAQTDQYHSGKFTSDRHFDTSVVDPQIGCAAALARMMALDTSLKIDAWFRPSVDHPIVMPNPVRAEAPADRDTKWVQGSLNLIAERDSEYATPMFVALEEIGKKMPLVTDGEYGAATKRAVRAFQFTHGGLIDDGKAGPLTLEAINDVVVADVAPEETPR